MVVLSVAQFMVILDATVVNVALPSIARSLSFAAEGLQWVVTAYVLASGGLVLLGGRAADVAGRRRIFLAGLTVFTAASLASGIAPAAGALIAARAGQGLGAALLTPAALSILTISYAGAQRATALGVWGAIGGGGAAVGVLAGGILTTWLGWRSVFLVNVPVGAVAGLLSLHLVPRQKPRRRFVRELDLPGAALAVAGLVTVTYALAGAPAHGWDRLGRCCRWPWRSSCWRRSLRSSGRRGGRWCRRRSGEPARWSPACWSCSAPPGSWSARSS